MYLMLECRTWQGLSLMKACYWVDLVKNFHYSIWHNLMYFFFYVAFEHFHFNVSIWFSLQGLLS